MADASLHMASITFRPPNSCRSSPYPTSLPGRRRRTLSEPTILTFSLRPNKCKPLASSSPPLPPIPTRNHIHSPHTGSTRTIATFVALALSLSKHLASKIYLLLSLNFRPALPNPITLATVSRPAFFAAIGDISLLPPGPPIFSPRNSTPPFRRNLSKPTNVSFPLLPPKCKLVASYSPPPPIPTRNRTHRQLTGSTAAWPLFFAAISPQIFSCVLLIRVLLGWFPDIQWDNPLMSALRDLCDPYLSVFRGIIPPLFNSLDVSPVLAFLLLGMLGQLARPAR